MQVLEQLIEVIKKVSDHSKHQPGDGTKSIIERYPGLAKALKEAEEYEEEDKPSGELSEVSCGSSDIHNQVAVTESLITTKNTKAYNWETARADVGDATLELTVDETMETVSNTISDPSKQDHEMPITDMANDPDL